MNYNELIEDVSKLVGLPLSSINSGAGITILEVDKHNSRIWLKNKTGEKRSRSLLELKNIWEQLCKSPAVHVDQVLNGSGSSRNQPETIFANLPYIEWLKHNNKKHIAFVGEHTHPYGTLKMMDEVGAVEIRQKLRGSLKNKDYTKIIVIANDIREASVNLERLTGIPVSPLCLGIYEQDIEGSKVVLVAQDQITPRIDPGTYLVIKREGFPVAGCIPVRINNDVFYVFNKSGLQYMISSS